MTGLPATTALDLNLDDGWLTLWFNEPKSRNPLTAKRIDDIQAVCDAIRDDRSVRGVTFRGRGGVFCAGGDLKSFKSAFQGGGDRDDIVRMSLQAASLFDSVNTLPQCTVMAVEGAAMAGGFGLACVGDVVLADDQARFALTETTIGLTPAQIAPFVLKRLGPREGRKLMLLASMLDAKEAETAGLVDMIVSGPEDMTAAIDGIRQQVRRCAPGAVAETKRLILTLPHLARKDQAEMAADSFAERMMSDEAREGVASFLEKRKPNWAEG
ncbi:enoyl-CoA hydratase/isomerase family protein [Hoeflea prorocentri]|uniref:Enoyl-CoA hydratase-related protein n=1 Tax=Hoeflea prorocentri TaxID=1922333 RepID=A0A9X3UNU8_9HYPH|nr:enoyl-CoA hydratase-related protein [Hoeflea prorocentri]MCY6382476.1 enoyl-CoA hydratase-related protein [Hoeflea prorocentri]MDA5400276.1 enoyl-CoA hydratase-related protein [Hoeflea prorocentri]